MRASGQVVLFDARTLWYSVDACCMIVVAWFIHCLSIVIFVDIIRHSSELLYIGKLVQVMTLTALQGHFMIVLSHVALQSRERRCTVCGRISA